MLTKISQLFVIHQKTTSFSYIRQAYDPCLRHGDELRSLHSCSTGSPACQGLRPRTPGCLIIAAWFHLVPMFSRAHVPMPMLIPCSCFQAHVDLTCLCSYHVDSMPVLPCPC